MKPSIHDTAALEAWRREHRVDPNQLRKMRHALYRELKPLDIAAGHIRDVATRHSLHAGFASQTLCEVERVDSDLDSSTKLVLSTGRGDIESVILRSSKRTTVCVSSQIGCAAGCQFCATGYMGLTANLTVAEILDQVWLANQSLVEEGRRVRNVVFMGMGEPFHNASAVQRAVEVLRSEQGFHISNRRILVSTVGVPVEMLEFARQFPEIPQALSLHSADQEIREKLIPWATRVKVCELRDTLLQLSDSRVPLMIEYIMLSDVTDSLTEARRLIRFLEGIRAHVNLIPYNPIEQFPEGKTSLRSVRNAFSTALRDAGIHTTIRYSMGDDIAAACGQLVQQRRNKATP